MKMTISKENYSKIFGIVDSKIESLNGVFKSGDCLCSTDGKRCHKIDISEIGISELMKDGILYEFALLKKGTFFEVLLNETERAAPEIDRFFDFESEKECFISINDKKSQSLSLIMYKIAKELDACINIDYLKPLVSGKYDVKTRTSDSVPLLFEDQNSSFKVVIMKIRTYK